MEILEMDNRNAISWYVGYARKRYSREELKEHYRFSCRIGCYRLANVYLYAIFGKKECFYKYSSIRGKIYAFKYPAIKKPIRK